MKKKVTLIPGDGIGPEVVGAAVKIIEAAGAAIEWERCEAGAEVFKKGDPTGVPMDTIESIQRTGVALKGPLETPVGYGEKSANVTLRKLFELYANIRPVRELPGVPTPFSGRNIDLVVVRENVEDLYAGIEHMQTPGVAQCLKLMSDKGCEKIIRLAFELARAEGRKSVHCATKANIMKFTEGLLKRTFERIAPEYPDIKAEHIIIDNCAHQLVRFPEQFEVIVTSNMNGDILSDLTSGLVGGLGFAPSANIGAGAVMFEAVHGSAPTIAGKNLANPTALTLSAVMLLRHLGMIEEAFVVENAVLHTLEVGKALTGDVAGERIAATTSAFTEAVINNLGRNPTRWQVREHKPLRMPPTRDAVATVSAKTRRTVGADLFIEADMPPSRLGPSLEKAVEGSAMTLKMCSNRGVKVYPAGATSPDCVDHYRCRFLARAPGAEVTDEMLADLVKRVGAHHRWMHLEKMQEFDGKAGYTKAQGED